MIRQVTYRCEECCDGICNFTVFYTESTGYPTNKPKRCPYKVGDVKSKWKLVE